MITSRNKAPEREDIEALLPWHAAGTLSRRDAERVEQALAQDAELARQFELVREEMAETIHLNETLGAPSTRAAQKLFAAIEAEGTSKKGHTVPFQMSGWLAGLMEQLSPRTLAWSAAAAATGSAFPPRTCPRTSSPKWWRGWPTTRTSSPSSPRRSNPHRSTNLLVITGPGRSAATR